MTKSMAWDLWAAKLIMGFCSVNTVFWPLLIHVAKQIPKSGKKKSKKVTLWIVDQRVITFKPPLIATKTKTLAEYGKKVDFLIQLSNRVEFWTVS